MQQELVVKITTARCDASLVTRSIDQVVVSLLGKKNVDS
jgi:hypothetical protein